MSALTRGCRFPVAGVHAAPRPSAERETELVYGERVWLLGDARDGYERVRVADGYEGFVAGGALAPAASHGIHADAGRVVVTARSAPLGRRREAALGAVFAVVAEEAAGFRVALPDGEMGVLDQAHAQPAGAATRLASGSAVVAEARRLLGVPYLWGGVTYRGLDCSGLVQTIHRRFLHLLPRNADDQERAGVAVDGERRPGDLLCYGDHVAIWTERATLVHAVSAAGGVVETAESPDLAARLRAIRRVF